MSLDQTSAAQKSALRRAARERRAQAAQEAGGEAAARLAAQFFAHVRLRPKSLIAGYAAINSEADPLPLLVEAAGLGHSCALPRIALEGAPLDFVAWRPGDPLTAGPFGTREPEGPPLSRVPDIVLVPMLAFDARGHRLGYGGGYYDRTLALLRAADAEFLAIGLAFAVQEADALPADRFDQKLDWVVTEREARKLG